MHKVKTNILVGLSTLAVILLIFFFFLPAFEGKISIQPTLSLGPIVIRWYGLILAGAILTGYTIARRYAWKFGISVTDLDDYSFWLVIIGILGARAYYVLFSLDYFGKNLSEIYKIWHGGLSIYGALIAGLIFSFIYSRKKAYTFLQLLDLVSLGLPISQALGRFGNFINQEAFGVPTNLPWKMYISESHRPIEFIHSNYFHPAFLYEALADVLVFLILIRLVGKVRSGQLILIYLATYGIFRFLIESIRIDSQYIYGVRVDQFTSIILVAVCGILMVLRNKQTKAR